MEKKLTLREIAPYLPYKLKCEVLNSGKDKEIGEMMAVYDDGSACFGNIVESEHGFEYVKPILRPIQEVELFFEDIWVLGNDKDVKKYLDSDFLWENGQIEINEIQLIEADKLPYGTLQVLLKYHFDVFDLIEKGLAIDINTLSQ